MQHITFADKSLLVGDEAARVLLEYAAAIAASGQADTVILHAISSDGDDVDATFLLNSGSPLMAETSTTQAAEPDNSDALDYMYSKLKLIKFPPYAIAESPANEIDFDNP